MSTIRIWNTFNQSEEDGEDQETGFDREEAPDKPEQFEYSVEQEVEDYAERDYDGADHLDEQEYSVRVSPSEVWKFVVRVEFSPTFSASRKK
jgi:hypothetical protein